MPEEDLNKDDSQENTQKSIRVFLSYSHLDNELVGNIKYYLETYGLEVFTAHDDIEPSLEWQEVILQELGGTDVFIPIITDNFPDSKWTDQETGIAIAKDKFIIPVSIGSFNPYGFIAKYQACKLKIGNNELGNSVSNIVKAIASKKGFSNTMAELIIKKLKVVNSFDNAGRLLSVLDLIDLNKEQADEVIKYSTENNQIYGSRNASPYLENHIKKYKKIMDAELLAMFSSVTEE